ncbi:uncharacterized protein N0V89_004196 [Didymosphaeria variabile]|uniref:Uncharacterized protein n=1 Tax=Didymosphaeria variabile TaxID=1932322 RepID=A0A9W8XRD7_9PLEO|nr:uncharacterized protein N0V89_004196 [Didymosphaeria variabile]KAJ4356166.1 hypothetical protein N0V89_004196 [Didymosphaeria variabile]
MSSPPPSRQQTPLTLGVFPLPSWHFQSANEVKKLFDLHVQEEAGSRNSRQPMATHWTLKYREGTKHAWREPPMLPMLPIIPSARYQHKQVTKADLCTIPLHKPGEADKAAHYKNFTKEYNDATRGWKSDKKDEKLAKTVFYDWERKYRRNWLYDDDFATIPGLLDWEMRCALEGNWRGLDHMLVEQQLKEPELMKPHPEYKLEWKLAVCVHREKQKQDEHKKKAKFVEKVDEEECSRYDRMHKWNDSQLAEFTDLMDEQEEEDEQRALAEKEFEVATLLMSMGSASPKAVVSSPKLSPPNKRKRAEKAKVTPSSRQSNSDGLRRSSRTKKLPPDSLSQTPAPRSLIGPSEVNDNDAPTTNSRPRLVLRLPSACS